MESTLIEDTLRTLLGFLGISLQSVRVLPEENGITRVDVTVDTPSRLIGWHGETLNAVQSLLKSIVRSKENLPKAPFLLLDVDGYRKEQEMKVCSIAEQKADFVRRTGSRIALRPMNPYFRRVVHLFVANTPTLNDLTTESVGEGDYRQIVLRLKKESGPKSEELSPVMAVENDGLENLDI